MAEERKLRIPEFAESVGYKPSTIRKKLLRREIAYHKIGRISVIPESEVDRLLADLRPRVPIQRGGGELDGVG